MPQIRGLAGGRGVRRVEGEEGGGGGWVS